MKVFGVLILLLFFVVGCAPMKSLEQLENDAMLTGDWSAVEKRERMIARKAERQGVKHQCPVGYISFCQTFAGRDQCGCVTRQGMRDLFAGR